VGENLNKELIYLAASSRILNDPISVLILSQSASGKTMIVDTVKELLPPEEVISVKSLSEQALNYAEDLDNKFISLGEAVHSETVEHQIREILSGKELSRYVTVKNPKTGEMASKLISSPAKRYYEKKYNIPEIVKKHRAAQRMLRKIIIDMPYSYLLDFPGNLMRTRRDNDRFLDLIACVCFLRQYQKEIQSDGETEYIECDMKDYEISYDIMINGVLLSSLSELPVATRELYDAFRKLSKKFARKRNLKAHEVTMTQYDIREKTGFGQSWIKQHMKILVDYEYIIKSGGSRRGARAYYRLREDVPIHQLDLSMIPTPDELEKRIKEEKRGKGKHTV